MSLFLSVQRILQIATSPDFCLVNVGKIINVCIVIKISILHYTSSSRYDACIVFPCLVIFVVVLSYYY
jgi:hypothetical protein